MSNARYTNMGHARYIGRIGALAVALGIGAGMFAMPFVASAKPSKPDTSSSTDSASTTSRQLPHRLRPRHRWRRSRKSL